MHQRGHPLVALAVERREDENQNAQHRAARNPFLVLLVEPLEERAHARVHRREVPRHQSAADAQHDEERNLPQLERVFGPQRHGQNGVEVA